MMIEQESENESDDGPDDRAVKIIPPVFDGSGFRLKPVPFFLGFLFGVALYLVLKFLYCKKPV